MELEPDHFFIKLHDYINDEKEGPLECVRQLSSLNKLFTKEQLNSSTIDLYILYIFDNTHGLLAFIESTKNKNKLFRSAIVTCIEIIHTFMNNYPYKLARYIIDINKTCLSLVLSGASSDEKVKALDLLILGFENVNKCVEYEEHYISLYRSLRNSLSHKKNASVVGKLVAALGIFAKKFPHLLMSNHEELETTFIVTLEKEMNERELSTKSIPGLFEALSAFYLSFPANPDDQNVDNITKLMKYIKQLAEPANTKQEIHRSALRFFTNNFDMFEKVLVRETKPLHKSLTQWLNRDNAQDQKEGYAALLSFYQGIVRRLELKQSDCFRSITNYFLDHFKSTLQNPSESNYKKRSAIHGIEIFVPAFHKQLSADVVKDIFYTRLQLLEENYIIHQDPGDERWEYLPDYIQLIASFFRFIDVTSSEWSSLQRAVIVLIRYYPSMSYSIKSTISNSLITTFSYLKDNEEQEHFDNFLEKVIYYGVTWTCSHQHITDADIVEEESSLKIITIRDYLQLWSGLVKPSRSHLKIDYYPISVKIVEKVIKTLLALINKLNISIVLKDSELPLTDPQSAYDMKKIDDYAIFLNVVDFYQDILPKLNPDMFEKCISKLVVYFIQKCNDFPLNSGLYKLLAVTLSISNKVDYFAESKLEAIQDVTNCHESLVQFMEALLIKMNSYKDELLIACLQVLLECPPSVIKEILDLCTPAFVTAFTVGRAYLKLAKMALSTLEHWQETIPHQDMEPFLKQILPHLDSYLRSRSLKGNVISNVVEKRRKTTQKLSKRKILAEIEPELVNLQRRILNFIGQQSSKLCQAFICSDHYIEPALISNKKYLKINLPYDDMKVDIELDNLVVKILDLAMYCSDPKTRATACELLHAIVILFLGKSKAMSTADLSDMDHLLKKIMLPLFQLGCDSDLIVRQLFEPLCFELIHWYTHERQQRTPHVAIMVEAMMEGITHSTDSSLRDFCGKCVNEYVKWTIKQTPEHQLAHDPINIKILVHKISFFAAHPDNSKKLGGSLIFNHMYRELREERKLFSMFWIELFHIYLTSLSQIEYRTVENEETVRQINFALDHLQRGFIEKSKLFNQPDDKRRIRSDIGGNVLKNVLLWLLKFTGSRSSCCRERASQIFVNLAPYVDEVKATTLHSFMMKHVPDISSWVQETYEGYLIIYPTLKDCKDNDSSQVLHRWIQAFSIGLEGYSFLMKGNYVPETLITESAPTIKALNFFLKEMLFKNLAETLQLISAEEWSYPMIETNQYQQEKADVILKILNFSLIVANSSSCKYDQNLIWSSEMWQLLTHYIFSPQELSFKFSKREKQTRSESLTQFLTAICTKLPLVYKETFICCIKEYISSNLVCNWHLNRSFPKKERNFFSGLAFLELTILKRELDLDVYRTGFIDNFINMFSNYNEMMPETKDTAYEFCQNVLQFAISSDVEFTILLKHIYNKTPVYCPEMIMKSSFGTYIFNKFEEIIVKVAITKFELFMDHIFSNNYSVSHTRYCLSKMINYMVANERNYKHLFSQTAKRILDHYNEFVTFFNTSVQSAYCGLDFMDQLLIFSPTVVKDTTIIEWVTELLRNEHLKPENEIALLDFQIRVLETLSRCFVDTEDNWNLCRRELEQTRVLFATSEKTTSTHMSKLILLLPFVRSPHLACEIITIFITNPKSVIEDILTDHLNKYIKALDNEMQFQSLQLLYDVHSTKIMTEHQKYTYANQIIRPVFFSATDTALEQFYIARMPSFLSILQEKAEDANIMQKIFVTILVEVLFSKIAIGCDERQNCPITEICLGSTSSVKLMQTCLKILLDVFRDKSPVSKSHQEYLRLYKCRSYNALQSILCNSVMKESFFSKLFIRWEDDRDILWRSLINCDIPFKFQEAFESTPRDRKIILNIRQKLNDERRMLQSNYRSPKYIKSQYLFKSTLSEDITRYDFSNAAMLSQSPNNIDYMQTETSNTVQNEIYLDDTEINNHEVMPTVCGVISLLFSSGITILPDEDEQPELPAWMEGIRKILMSDTTHNNIKIFLVRVIYNTADKFRYYAKFFREPLFKFIIDKCAGDNLNYFITDTISLLASWSIKDEPSIVERNLASKLLEFVIERIQSNRTDIFKYRLELIKLITEAWLPFLRVPSDLLMKKLSANVASRSIEEGIHIAAIILAQSSPPWHESNRSVYLNRLLEILNISKEKKVYKPCAETIGLTLKYLQKHGEDGDYCNDVQSLLKNMSNADIDKYTYSLEGIIIHYNDIANDSFHFSKLLSRLNCSSNLQLTFLKIISQRTDVLEEISDFKIVPWAKCLGSDNIDVRLITLTIMSKCLDIVENITEFKDIIQSILKNATNPNHTCRSLVYDVTINICRTNSLNNKRFTLVINQCYDVIVEGLIDSDLDNREKIRQFITEGLPNETPKRFSYILSRLYKPSTEGLFLNYSTYFLLNSLKNHEDYEKDIFTSPLENCDFEEYKIMANWRRHNPCEVPLFAETLRTNTNDIEMSNSDWNYLRRTQVNLTFAPTRSVKEQELAQVTKSQSSLHINLETEDSETTFVNPNTVTLLYDYRQYKILKRYFTINKAKISRLFAEKEIKKSHDKIRKRYEMAKESEKKVSIYRSYRKGDFPDIEIPLSSLLDPLLALCEKDGEVSKTLYLVLFQSLVKKTFGDDDFFNTVTDGIKSIFENSIEFNTSVFRTFLDILIHNKNRLNISPDLISKVCQSSGLLSTGTLLLEEYLISLDVEPPTAKMSRGSSSSNNEINYWVKTSELYREMGEWDVVRAIFLSKMDCDETAHKAVLAESQKYWKDAQELYREIINKDTSLDRRDFYYESYFKCFAYLGDWDRLPNTIESFVSEEPQNAWENLWDSSWNQQKLLPWYIESHIKQMIFKQKITNSFVNNINNYLKNPDKSGYLKSNFAEELCMMWIFKSKTDVANIYLRSEMDAFISSWQVIDPMFSTLRYNKILKLRNIVDIHDFTKVYDNLNPYDCEKVLCKLQTFWDATSNENLPSILLNETQILYRKQFINLLIGKVQSFKDQEDVKDLVESLKNTNIKLIYSMLDIAVSEGNYYMAKRYYPLLKESGDMQNPKLPIIGSDILQLKVDLHSRVKEKLDILESALPPLNKAISKQQHNDIYLSAHLKYFEIIEKFSAIFTNNDSIFNSYKNQMKTILEDKEVDISTLGDLTKYSVRKLKNATQQFEEYIHELSTDEMPYTKELSLTASSYSKLSYFLQGQGEFIEDFIICVLRGMRLGSAEVRQLFPCILMEKNLDTRYKNLFQSEAEKIPTWMFLGWIPQLLTTIDSKNILATSKIILKIARAYPQAVMYNYRLSKETFSSATLSTESKELIGRLDDILLSDPIIDKFLTALRNVNLPATVLKYHVEKIIKAAILGLKENVKTSQAYILNELYSDCPDSDDTESMIGKQYKDITPFKREIQILNCDNLTDVQKKMGLLRQKLSNIISENKKNKIILLKDLCPWLANYSSAKLNFELEIPGQYDGTKMPLVQHHIKIFGFIQTGHILESLRAPVKVTILGNDTREYSFLVKYGEDLRQDQRIEQLFSLMNSFFQADSACSRNHLSLMVYQVIPLTTSLGILQWVDDTTKLGEFILKTVQHTRKQRAGESFEQKLQSEHYTWISKNQKIENVHIFGRAAITFDRQKTETKYRELVGRVRWDALRIAFSELSVNTESFIALRNNFIKSYAVICASHWILGIGDRHLSNTLLCKRSGKALGVDFGYSFGTSTQLLDAPELVPFRLTPHILYLMEPLKEHGYFRENLIHTLDSLRGNSRSLLAAMNVFIEEPSLDWLENAMRVEGSAERSKIEWYPKQKVDQAKRKLQGGNSTVFMIEDLKSGHKSRPDYMKAYIKLVEGEPETIRARKPKDNLSTQDQADCLIDHATDYNLLGRMYSGWEAWI